MKYLTTLKWPIMAMIFICTNTYLAAQKTNYLSFSIGSSNAKGRLGEADYNDSSTGYGTFGLAYNLKYEMKLKKGWGLYYNLQNASILFDAKQYTLDIEKDLGSDWSWSEYTPSSYNVKSLNLGVQYTLNEGQKFNATGYFGSGLSLCKNRSVDASFASTSGTIRITAESLSTIVTNINFGLKVCYAIKPNIDICADFAYQTQSPIFVNNYNLYLNGMFFDKDKQTFTQPMYFSTTTIGLRYKFATKEKKS